MTIERPISGPEPLERVRRDIRQAAKLLTLSEVRYLVDAYYQIQGYRITAASQMRAAAGQPPLEAPADDEEDVAPPEGEPDSLLSWTFSSYRRIEDEIKLALDKFSRVQPLGMWARSICGIGPVITSGLLAHIDIAKAPTAGHIWSFAGLNPSAVWEKGQKRPWNADLRVIAWKAGESFVKVCNNKNDVYGHLYANRKVQEIERNERFAFRDQAEEKLATKRIRPTTDAYKAYAEGKLPPAHVHARAKRYAVKHFLADFQHVAWELAYNEVPPKPFVIEHLGHVHLRPIPNHACLGA